jgi:hypothetical protein
MTTYWSGILVRTIGLDVARLWGVAYPVRGDVIGRHAFFSARRLVHVRQPLACRGRVGIMPSFTQAVGRISSKET